MLLTKSGKEEVIYNYTEEINFENTEDRNLQEPEKRRIDSKIIFSMFNQNDILHGFAKFLNTTEKNEGLYSEISELFNKLYFKLYSDGGLAEITNKSQMLTDIEKNIFQIINDNPEEAVNIFNFFTASKQLLRDKSLLEMINSGKGVFSLLFPEVFNKEFVDKIVVKKIYFDVIEGLPVPIEKIYELLEDKKKEIVFRIKTKIDYEKISEIDLIQSIKEMYDIPKDEALKLEYSGNGIIKIDKKYGIVNEIAERKQVIFQNTKKIINYNLVKEKKEEDVVFEEIDLDDKSEVNHLIIDTFEAVNNEDYFKITANYKLLYQINKKLLKEEIIWKNLSIVVRMTNELMKENNFKSYLNKSKEIYDFKKHIAWCEQDIRLFKPDVK